MFAPRVATIQTRGDAGSTGRFGQRTSRQAKGEHDGGHEREIVRENLTDPAAPRRIAWDFGKIPLFPPDQASRSQASYPLPGIIQRKLVVGAVNDPLEHEADRVADQVMRMPAPDVSVAAAPLQVSRKCAACEEEEKAPALQTKRSGSAELAAAEAPPSVDEVLRSPGRPLDRSSRGFFEPRFGHDFSQVRVHVDTPATAAVAAVKARAFTAGSNIVFGRGQYAPSTIEGRHLLAHELTHVVQQTRPAAEVHATSDSFAERTSAPPRNRGGGLPLYPQGEPATVPLAYATLRRDVNKDFPEAPPKATTRPVSHPPLSTYNDSDPKHDPSLLTDAQIKATAEYQDLSTKTYPPRKAPVSEQIALLACRLMLRRMRETSMLVVTMMSDAPSFLDQADKQAGTLAATEQQVGHLGWVPFSTGAAVSNPSALPTEFGRWVLAGGPMPDKMSGKVNCWEMVLFGAYKAGYIDFARIKQIYDEAVVNVKARKAPLVGTTVEAKLRRGDEHVFDPGDPDSPAPLPGDLVIFKEAATHVAIATGTISGGKHEVISLWNQPANISTVQRTTIEDLLAIVGSSGRPVKFWSANW
jgi:hypothetical protein